MILPDVKFISPEWNAPNNVKALITTRLGGVSASPYGEFNLGMHVGDANDAVIKNRQILTKAAELPTQPAWLNQTHSTKVVKLTANSAIGDLDCDGAMTQTRGIVCAVMTADCLPLFLSSEDGKQVALLHVGWRGLADGIIQNGVNLFECATSQIIAWAGPCISRAHFEIGEEVKCLLGGAELAYKKSKKRDKFYADMFVLTGEVLAQCGVNQYSYSRSCTFRDEELFYSYRRDQVTGRMASLIWIE